MKISSLKKVFTGEKDLLLFRSSIKDQIDLYEQSHHKKGSSIPIELTEDAVLHFGKNEFVFLCKAYIDETLSRYEVSYITEALLLSSYVVIETELIREGLEFFGDIESDKKMSTDEVQEILNRILSN